MRKASSNSTRISTHKGLTRGKTEGSRGQVRTWFQSFLKRHKSLFTRLYVCLRWWEPWCTNKARFSSGGLFMEQGRRDCGCPSPKATHLLAPHKNWGLQRWRALSAVMKQVSVAGVGIWTQVCVVSKPFLFLHCHATSFSINAILSRNHGKLVGSNFTNHKIWKINYTSENPKLSPRKSII